MRCLWISRDLPFPVDAGDKVYSANIARSLGEAGIYVRFLGFGSTANVPPEWPVDFCAVAGQKHSSLRALFSFYPIAAAIHDTNGYRNTLKLQLRETWDVVVLDNYGSGWALKTCVKLREHKQSRSPLLVYLSHNHEEYVWKTMARESKAAFPKKAALWQNYFKVRLLENRLLRSVNLISTITEEDAGTYATQGATKPTIVLTPGYSGWVAPDREITPDTPSHIILLGSFRWVVKQENLRRFVKMADAPFAEAGIQLDVIGDVPQPLLDDLKPVSRATRFHGFVEDVGPLFSTAKMAVVPEPIGGGFKLKTLDYIFGRVPVASLTGAAAGLPASVRANMLCRDDLRQLVDAIIQTVRKPGQLNTMQQGAFAAALRQFQWHDRGRKFKEALEALC